MVGPLVLALGEFQTYQGKLVALLDGRSENTSAHLCGHSPKVSLIRQKGKQQLAFLPPLRKETGLVGH